ncbi:CPBP family intramembrane metalloprotease [Sphingomonas sp. HDW15A]|uniref:CPBP family intramembrane glutamic endopeptidase n=1 Tax=Sphingomonas sp. HDW15A TaxID=2714942 RepID=UPI00140762F0|nr:type II CAAX endopeptidase family protein [Sphingomonas sp. HDW15A]QIK97028.1 CPBP family intramembrane metalloprotease [Sphingomonas sp. HDW15A]
MTDTKRNIALFLGLTFGLSALTWIPQIQAGTIHPLWILATMWCPAVAAIVTRLATQGNLGGFGWKPGKAKWLALAYVLPVLYALPVYLIAWFGGLGTFDEGKWIVAPNLTPVTGLAMIATAGLAASLLSATGEEIGWRGFLVPELLKLTAFRRTALMSGLVWAAWHMPLMIFAGYHGNGTPLLYSIACFTVMVVGLAVIMAWITAKSGSFWPAAMLHATHNLFVQGVFDAATVTDNYSAYWTGEFGAGLALSIALAAGLCLRLSPLDGDDAHEKGAARRTAPIP